MEYVIMSKHKKNGNVYFVAGAIGECYPKSPINVMRYRAENNALRFSCIATACDFVKQLRRDSWRYLIRPATRRFWFFLPDWCDCLRSGGDR